MIMKQGNQMIQTKGQMIMIQGTQMIQTKGQRIMMQENQLIQIKEQATMIQEKLVNKTHGLKCVHILQSGRMFMTKEICVTKIEGQMQ